MRHGVRAGRAGRVIDPDTAVLRTARCGELRRAHIRLSGVFRTGREGT